MIGPRSSGLGCWSRARALAVAKDTRAHIGPCNACHRAAPESAASWWERDSTRGVNLGNLPDQGIKLRVSTPIREPPRVFRKRAEEEEEEEEGGGGRFIHGRRSELRGGLEEEEEVSRSLLHLSFY